MAALKTNAMELKSFNKDKFNPVLVYGTDEVKVITAFFKPGQFIPVHTPGVDVVFYIIEGEAELVAGSERHEVGPHDIVVVPSGEKRGIRARTELSVLHVVQPAPSEKDHAEVGEKLGEGRFE